MIVLVCEEVGLSQQTQPTDSMSDHRLRRWRLNNKPMLGQPLVMLENCSILILLHLQKILFSYVKK